MSAGSIAAGLVSKTVGSALQRGVSVIFQKLTRLRRVDATLQGITSSSPSVAAAIADYETILGSYYGNFTVQVSKFHRELETTGIADAMVENALLDRKSDSVYSLFEREHRRFFPGSESAEKLYNQMSLAFGTTMRELCKDPVLLDFLQGSSRVISARLDSIDLAISAMSINSIRPDPDEHEFKSAYLRLSRGLQQSYKEVRIETIRGGARPVDIDKIYIPPKLSLRSTNRNDNLVNNALSSLENDAAARRTSQQQSHFVTSVVRARTQESMRRVTYSELKSSFKRIVVLGDPGGGKSTICQKICYDLARGTALVTQHGDRNGVIPSDQKLPIRIILRRFEQARLTAPQLDLLTYICRDVVTQVSSDENTARGLLLPSLQNGQVVLAFDGLDEILETSKRREVVELVRAFCEQFPLCPVIVTSRLVGYDDARLPDEFEEYVLDRFSDEEVKEYLRKFMIVVGEKSKDEARSEASRFLVQTENTASDLRRNPLLLGLMAYLFNTKGDVPGNRPEIYKDCATLMFERWDTRRGINADVPSDFEKSELFSDLASRLYPNEELSAGVDTSWLKSAMREFFQKQYLDRPRAISVSNSLVEFITGRAWIMSEVGDGVFSFTHQTFLEYFFARHLDTSYDAVSGLLRALKPRVVKHEWDVVAHLALQLKTHGVIRKQEDALRWLMDAIAKSKKVSERSALTMFAAQSLEYLSGAESSTRDLIEALFSAARLNVVRENWRAFLAIGQAYSSSRGRKAFVGSVIATRFADLINGTDRQLAAIVAEISVAKPEPTHRPSPSLKLSASVISSVHEEAKSRIIERAPYDPLAASLAYQWYGVFKASSIRSHGLVAFLKPYVDSDEFDIVTWSALCTLERYRSQFKGVIRDPAEFKTFIAALGYLEAADVRNVPIDSFREYPPPLQIWVNVMSAARSNSDVLAGLMVAEAFSRRSLELYKSYLLEDPVGPYRVSPMVQKRFENMRDAAIRWGGDRLQATLDEIRMVAPPILADR